MRKKILQFFHTEKTSSLQFWVLIGPFFLFLSLFLIVSSYEVLLAYSLFSFFLYWKYQKKGFYLSLSVLPIVVILNHLNISSHVWSLGLELYVVSALFLTYLALEKAFNLEKKLLQKIEKTKLFYENLSRKHEKRFYELKEKLATLLEEVKEKEKEIFQRDRQLHSLKNLNAILLDTKELNEGIQRDLQTKLRNQHVELFHQQKKLNEIHQKLENYQDQKVIKARQKDLLDELNQVRIQSFQTQMLLEALRKNYLNKLKKQTPVILQKAILPQKEKPDPLLSQKVDETAKLLKNAEQKISSFKTIEVDFIQLRKQFDEKNEVLHTIRGELFHLHTQKICIENSLNEKDLVVTEEEQGLFKVIDDLEKENQKILSENKQLEELVHFCLEETTKKKPFVLPKKTQSKLPL